MPNVDLSQNEINRLKSILVLSKQNDNFRKCPYITEDMGKIVFTEAIRDKGLDFFLEALEKIQEFIDFEPDLDPFGTHEMGQVVVQGIRVLWQIDLYNADYSAAPNDPTCLASTRRILKVLFPFETDQSIILEKF